MSKWLRRAIIGTAMFAAFLVGTPIAHADPRDETFEALNRADGTRLAAKVTQERIAPQPTSSARGSAVVDPASVVTYHYETTTTCTMDPPGTATEVAGCARMARECPESSDPAARLWRQPMQGGQPVGPWEMLGTMCSPDEMPTERPELPMAMVLRAFHLTPWATARTQIEPVGNVTLVGLDTFYRVEWSAQGYEPGEIETINPSRMLGYRVDIRPKLVSLTYRFGDGSEFGPTPSLGGGYPSGPIRHQYSSTGDFSANVQVTWGADFRIDGGPWAAVPDTVTVPGPPTQVQVKAARAVLVQN